MPRRPRRVGGRLRPLTTEDRARKAARNERRGRVAVPPAHPRARQQPLTLERRERIAENAIRVDLRAALAFVGRKRRRRKDPDVQSREVREQRRVARKAGHRG